MAKETDNIKGTNVYIENAKEDYVTDFKLDANTEQVVIEAEEGKTVSGENIYVSDVDATKEALININGNKYQETIEGEAGTTVVGEKINVKDVDIEKEASIFLDAPETTQNGTPTPDFPADIEYVKGSFESYNIFNVKKWLNAWKEYNNYKAYTGTVSELTENSFKLTANQGVPETYTETNENIENLRVNLKPNTTYTFYFKKETNVSIDIYVFFYETVNSNKSSSNKFISLRRQKSGTIITPDNFEVATLRFDVNEAGASEIFSDIMIIEGAYTDENIPPYKPYGIVNSQYDITMQNKNLCPPLNEWTLSNGAYIDDEGYIVLPETNSSARCYIEWNKINNKFYIQLDTVAEIENSYKTGNVAYLDKNKKPISAQYNANGFATTFNTPKDYKYRIILPYKFNNTYDKSINEASYLVMQLNRVDSNENDAPYKFKNVTLNPYGYVDYIEHEQDTHYIDLPYKLAKLGDAKDHFNIDWHFEDDYKVVDKVWYVEEVGIAKLSELTWELRPTNIEQAKRYRADNFTDNIKLSTDSDTTGNILCNILKAVSSNDTYARTEGIAVSSEGNRLFIYIDILSQETTTDKLVKLLQDTDATLFYELATPTTTEVTDETLKAEFEGMLNILPYEETNIVVSGDGTESKLPLVEFKYNYITESPSVPRPSDIKYVKGDYEVKVQNKNLWIPEIDGIGAHRCKVSLNNDEYIFEITGNDAYFGEVRISVGLEWIKGLGTLYDVQNVDYISIFVTNELFDNNYITLYDENKMSLKFSKLESNKTVYDVRNASYITLRIGIRNPVIGETYKTKIQLTYSDTPTDNYIPHQSQTVELKNLPEMYSDEDTIEITYEDNNGYRNLKSARVKNAWGKYEFTGEETLIKNLPTHKNSYVYFINFNREKTTKDLAYSNYLKYFKSLSEMNKDNVEGFYIYKYVDTVYLYIGIKTQENTIASIKAWLKQKYDNNNPLTIIYPLDTPTYTDIQDTELKNKLEELINLNMYDEITNISQNTVELPANLVLRYNFVTPSPSIIKSSPIKYPNGEYEITQTTKEDIFNFQLSLGKYKLAKIGDIKDKFNVEFTTDSTNYKRITKLEYIENTGIYEFNGEENWGYFDKDTKENGYATTFNISSSKNNMDYSNKVICNMLSYNASLTSSNEPYLISLTSSNAGLTIKLDTSVENADDIKQIIKNKYDNNNPFIMLYKLITPKITDITSSSLKSQLEKLLNMYIEEGSNHIEITGENLLPYLDITYTTEYEDEYDFYIKDNKYFIVPEQNIEFLYSPQESTVPDIAEATEATVKIAGRDGDLVLATNYEPMSFDLVAYTDENLSPEQKMQEVSKLTRFLNSIKNKTKQLAFLDENKMYPVKYNNQLTTTKYPKSARFEIPLKSSKSYATKLHKTRIFGASIKNSDTIEPVGCKIIIRGPANKPIISLNNYQMKYDNVVLDGNTLIIDTGNSTIKHITSQGVETNAAIYYNHEYPKIQYGENEIKILSGIDNESQVMTEWYDLKL